MSPDPVAVPSAAAKIDPEVLSARARALFVSGGLTCSESMLQAGCEALGVTSPLIPGIALGLGGGVGGQGRTCGILTGAALSVSAAVTALRPDLDRPEKRRRVMAATATLVQAFQAENHHTDCLGICGLDVHAPNVTPQAKAVIRNRVCAPCLAGCARVLAEVLNDLTSSPPPAP